MPANPDTEVKVMESKNTINTFKINTSILFHPLVTSVIIGYFVFHKMIRLISPLHFTWYLYVYIALSMFIFILPIKKGNYISMVIFFYRANRKCYIDNSLLTLLFFLLLSLLYNFLVGNGDINYYIVSFLLPFGGWLYVRNIDISQNSVDRLICVISLLLVVSYIYDFVSWNEFLNLPIIVDYKAVERLGIASNRHDPFGDWVMHFWHNKKLFSPGGVMIMHQTVGVIFVALFYYHLQVLLERKKNIIVLVGLMFFNFICMILSMSGTAYMLFMIMMGVCFLLSDRSFKNIPFILVLLLSFPVAACLRLKGDGAEKILDYWNVGISEFGGFWAAIFDHPIAFIFGDSSRKSYDSASQLFDLVFNIGIINYFILLFSIFISCRRLLVLAKTIGKGLVMIVLSIFFGSMHYDCISDSPASMILFFIFGLASSLERMNYRSTIIHNLP